MSDFGLLGFEEGYLKLEVAVVALEVLIYLFED
jgi:hypothetical protein